MGNFGKGNYEEHLCDNILNLGRQFRSCCGLTNFLILGLAAICSAQQNCFGTSGREPYKESLNENILNLGHQFRRRCRFKSFLFFSSGSLAKQNCL